MAIMFRENRNPLGEALANLSQQMLAVKAQQMQNEYAAKENERVRAWQSGEREATQRYLSTESAADRLDSGKRFERTSGIEEKRITSDELKSLAQTEALRDVGVRTAEEGRRAEEARAGALMNEANKRYALLESQIKADAEQRTQWLTLQADALGFEYDPKTKSFARKAELPVDRKTGAAKLGYAAFTQEEIEEGDKFGLNLKQYMREGEVSTALNAAKNIGFWDKFSNSFGESQSMFTGSPGEQFAARSLLSLSPQTMVSAGYVKSGKEAENITNTLKDRYNDLINAGLDEAIRFKNEERAQALATRMLGGVAPNTPYSVPMTGRAAE